MAVVPRTEPLSVHRNGVGAVGAGLDCDLLTIEPKCFKPPGPHDHLWGFVSH